MGNSASLSFTAEANTASFQTLVNNFPALKVRYLSQIAKNGRLTLKGMLDGSGGMINLTKERGSSGKRTIKATVLHKKSSIKFSSFPVNLFENGRLLRNGEREAPRKIITGKFKGVAQSMLQTWANQAENDILEQAVSRV